MTDYKQSNRELVAGVADSLTNLANNKVPLMNKLIAACIGITLDYGDSQVNRGDDIPTELQTVISLLHLLEDCITVTGNVLTDDVQTLLKLEFPKTEDR